MLEKVIQGLAVASLAAGLVACSGASQAASSSASTPAPAASSTAAPAANAAQSVTGTPRPRGGAFASGNNAFGQVATISGTTLTLKSPQGSQVATVKLTGSTTIHKQTTVAIGDVKPGLAIRAFGQESNGVLQARQIQLDPNAAPANRPAGARGPGRAGPNGAPNATRRAGQNGTAVIGTVESVSGNTITVKPSSGSTVQVQLASNGRIMETATGSASEIKQGDTIFASGQRQGNTLTATDVNIGNGPIGAPRG